MRSNFNWLLVLGVGAIVGCGAGDGGPKRSSAPVHTTSLFRFYFSGTTRLTADTNAAPWVSMSELPASQALWRQTLEKLAQTPYQLFQRRIEATTNRYASTFQELIGDFVRAESFAEVTGDTNRIAEYELAVRLPADRAEFWRTNLLSILESWTGSRAETIPAGWQLKKHHDPKLLRLVRSGDWTLIGCGQDQLALQDEYLRRIKQSGSPALATTDPLVGAVRSRYWLEVFLDCPNLPLLTPPLLPSDRKRGALNLPAMDLYLTPHGSNLRINGNFAFRESFTWEHEPWQIPTNLVRDPIISFTAAQGFAPMLKNHQEALGLRLDSVPNQFFMWAGALLPVQTLAAAPTKDAAGFLRDLVPQFIARFDPELQANNTGSLVMATNLSGEPMLRWVGIPPFVTPFVSTAQDGGRDFLLAGIHPNWSGTNPPPVLFHHLASRTNLVYYDWEITGQHAWACRNVVNIFRHIVEKPRLQPDTASIVWLNSISNRLGNTVTEVTRADANRLSLVRHGPVGLTGIELIVLAHWLESPGFPLNGFALPARTDAAPTSPSR